MSVEEAVRERGIEEVLHFTTNRGLLGILDAKAVRSRARLQTDQRLEFVLRLNTPIVRDPGWEDYVNLSISRINSTLFGISSGRWHPDVWWCVLAFEPTVLSHSGVVFVTTNNCYPRAKRALGGQALEALFAPIVISRYDSRVTRPLALPPCYPTCEQAEVLYPQQLSTDSLTRIYVRGSEEQDDAYGLMEGVQHPEVPVLVAPNVFQPWMAQSDGS